MAKKQNTAAAARERKQKIFVAIGFVILAGLMVLQGPKLLDALKGGSSTAPAAQPAAATPATPATDPVTGAPVASPTPSATFVKAPKSSKAELAGVVIVPEQPVKAGDGQLNSFSRFDSKDPFVQQVKPEPLLTPAQVGGLKAQTSGTPDAAAKKAAAAAAAAAAAGAGAPAGQAGSTPSVPMNLNMAMLRVNGNLHFVELQKRFPKTDRAFVLKTIKPGRVSISVADGNFVGGGTLVLRVGRTTTLVNTATGARYVVKLLWVGDASQLTRFNDAK
jgi:hypothetical protein